MLILGIDVSKAKIDCCIFPQGLTGKRKTKVFPNVKSGFAKLKEWLIGLGINVTEITAVMEATSVYHENLAQDLYDSGLKVCIANPARVRAFAQSMSMLSKTDKADSEVLARYGLTAELTTWQPEPAHIRLLKALLDRRTVVVEDLQREQNRLEKAEFTQTAQQVLDSIENHIKQLDQEIARLDEEISNHVDGAPDLKNDLDLLTSIPAVGERTGLLMLSLLRSHHFEKASQAAAFVGLVPVHFHSGSSVNRRSRLSKAGSSKVRSGLYMAAIVATKHNPHISAMYERLCSKGKAKMLAIGAAMRKLVHLCFGVLKHQMPYQKDYLLIE